MLAGYNEYKYEVTHEKLQFVLSTLEALYGGTDPFPSGVVDSIYYDSLDRICYHQCFDGNNIKTKFRIRGYGNGLFQQIHRKEKDVFTVNKLKSKINNISCHGGIAPEWGDIESVANIDKSYSMIKSISDNFGVLYPSIRVEYNRHRFRVFDYRITLDSQIKVTSFANGLSSVASFAILPYNVLEIKTPDPRPHLPTLGLTRLQQISFSKFYLGLNMLLFPNEVA
jgi:hypothetical protein